MNSAMLIQIGIRTFGETTTRQVILFSLHQHRSVSDVVACYADNAGASKQLNWCAIYDLEMMCRDIWKRQFASQNGFN